MITDPHATHFVTDLGAELEWSDAEGNSKGTFPRYAVWAKGRKPEVVETFYTLEKLYEFWPELEGLEVINVSQ